MLHRTKIQTICRNPSLLKRHSSTKPKRETPDPIQTICKIMSSTPVAALDTALDHAGVRLTPEIAEHVLARFQNAGLLAHRFFQWAAKQRGYSHSVRAHHAAIESLAKIRQYQLMWELVSAMRSNDTLNVETFCIIMRKYARARKIDEALYTFNVMEKHGVSQNLAAFNGLLSALCKSRNVRKAQEIFDKMKDRFEPDSKTYSILIDGWGKEPNLPRAREVFREMVDLGIKPDVVTYGIMVDVLCKAGRVDEAIESVRHMDSNGCKPTSFIYSVLVHTYGVESRIEDAVDAFMEMERRGVEADVVVYNALIGAFARVDRFKNAKRVLNDMNSKGVRPNSRTCNVMLNGLIGRGRTEEAVKVFRRMSKVCEPDADTYTMMIKMFCEKGEVDMALEVWKHMKSKRFVPSMHMFSVLINGLCEKKDASRACVLMEEMIEKGIRPAGVTFGRLRQLLMKEGRDDVLKFLQQKMNLLVKEPLCD
ncbi:hypothetical protein L484_013395 [Morus notabilis]|uniref:Pentacotripeptide-repeat region of PRORP domain-containing protein n=1 Tax=Morus notabilis TaxID=981085 RepID=W9QZ99_9ROSA|nr:pentatricopeptide repeat-containing protein At1g77360, mitochondrial [Morus notabilis]EXB60130.1 hypothetical protein L484_013395 [Morus notabilis]